MTRTNQPAPGLQAQLPFATNLHLVTTLMLPLELGSEVWRISGGKAPCRGPDAG
jgi:hypothetical protein